MKTLIGFCCFAVLLVDMAVSPVSAQDRTVPVGSFFESGPANADSGVAYGSTGTADGGRLITIDPLTGAGTLIGLTGLGAVPSLAISGAGEIFASDASSGDIYRIDAATGAATFVSSTGLFALQAMAFDRNSVLYGISFQPPDFNLYIIDPLSGQLTVVGPTGDYFSGMAFDPITGALWASGGGASSVADGIHTINLADGTPTLVGTTGLGGSTPDLFFDPAGNLFGSKGGGSNPNNLISINKSTGTGSVVGPIGFNSVSGLAVRLDPIPGNHIGVVPELDFGKVQLGAGKTRSVRINNIGDQDLTVTSISDPGAPFSLDSLPGLPALISPGSFETFDVVFSPAVEGTFNGTITISSDDPDDPTVDVSVTGEGIFIHPAEPSICYASTGHVDGGRLLFIDEATGAGSLIGPTGVSAMPGLAISSTGAIIGGDSFGGLYRVDAASGQAIFLLDPGFGGALSGIAFDSSDVFFGVAGGALYTIDLLSGQTTLIGNLPDNFRGLAFDPVDGSLWATVWDQIYTVNPANGNATLVGSTGHFLGNTDLHFDADGNLYAAAGGGSNPNVLLSIDKGTGAGTIIGPIGFNSVSGLASLPVRPTGPNIAVLPAKTNFGLHPVNFPAPVRNITIKNTGSDTLSVFGITEPAPPFFVGNLPSTPFVLAPGVSQTLLGLFDPDTVGSFAGSLTVISNDPEDSVKTVQVLGEGVVVTPADTGQLFGSTGFADGGRLLLIEPATGAGELKGATSAGAMPGLAINSSGAIIGSDHAGNLYLVDSQTGSSVLLVSTALQGLEAIAFNPGGVLYGADDQGDAPGETGGGGRLVTIDLATGTFTHVGFTLFPFKGLAFDPTDGQLWGSFGDELYLIDTTNGDETFVGATGLGGQTPDIAFDPAGNLFGSKGGGSEPNFLIFIDKTDASGTVIGPIGFQAVSGLAFHPAPLAGPRLRVLPMNADFGVSALDSSSQSLSIFLSNYGTNTVTVSGIADPQAPFTLDGLPGLPVMIPPGGLVTFEVKLARDSGGVFLDSVVVTSDDPGAPIQTITLTGEVVLLSNADSLVSYATTGGSDGGRLIRLNLLSGAGTLIGPTGLGAVPGVAINSTGEIYATDVFDLYRLDAATGIAIRIGPLGEAFTALAFDLNDQLYGSGYVGLYSIDPVTAGITWIGSTGPSFRGLAFDPLGGTLWGSDALGDIYTINVETAASTWIGNTGLGAGVPDIHFDHNGELFGVAGGGQSTNNLISINKSTGAGTIVGPIGFSSVSGSAFYHGILVGIDDRSASLPRKVTLHQNYPNPFNPSTTIKYDLPEDGKVTLKIYNVLGQEVRTLVSKHVRAGYHKVVWDGKNNFGVTVGSGLYVYRLQTGKNVLARKMMFLK